ncbi:MAG: hypothetical protein ACFFB5_11755 [Promethearchaeota archaeon]
MEFTFRTGGNMLLALIGALIWAELYYFIILFLIHLSRKWKKNNRSKYPELGDIPDSATPDQKSPSQSTSISPSVHNDMSLD